MTTENIIIKRIQVPKNIRTPSHIEELAQSILEVGLLNPIVVRDLGDHMELVFGHRRLQAVKSLGWQTIEAKVVEASDQEALVQALVENVVREDMPPLEIAKALDEIKTTTNATEEELGKYFGWSKGNVNKYLDLLNYESFAGETLTPRHVEQAKTGTGNDPKLTKKVLRTAVKKHWSSRETRKRAEAARSAQLFDGAKGVNWALGRELPEVDTVPKPSHRTGTQPVPSKGSKPVRAEEAVKVFQWVRQPITQRVESTLIELTGSCMGFIDQIVDTKLKVKEGTTILKQVGIRLKALADILVEAGDDIQDVYEIIHKADKIEDPGAYWEFLRDEIEKKGWKK